MSRADGVTIVSGDDDHTAVALSHHDQVNEERRQVLEAAYSEGVAEVEAETDIEESAELAEEVGRSFGARDYEVVKAFIGLEQAMKTDPVGAATRLEQWYRRNPQFGEPEKPEELKGAYGEVGVKLPNGNVVWAQPGSIKHEAALAMAKAGTPEDSARRKEARAMLKQAYPNLSYKQALSHIREIHREASKNPMKAAAKIAASYGMNPDPSPSAPKLDVDYIIDTEFPLLRKHGAEAAAIIKQMKLSGDLRRDLTAINNELVVRQVHAEHKAFMAKYNPPMPVRQRMADLLNTGKAGNLEEAYKLATEPGLTGDIKHNLKAAIGNAEKALEGR